MGGEPIATKQRCSTRALTASAIVVCLIVAIVHGPALSSGALSFDDGEYLVGNRLVQYPSWASAWRFLSEVREPSTVHGYYQPLNMISIMLDYAMGGRDDYLRPFHRTSLILHAVNAGLWVVLLYRLFGDPIAAATAALLFGAHPLTVESLPWVGERKTLLAAFFALISLISYVRYAQRRSISAYVFSVIAFSLALLAKPTSTPVPLLMLLLDFWPLGRFSITDRTNWNNSLDVSLPAAARLRPETWQRLLLEKLPFLSIGAMSAAVTFLSQRATHTAAVPGEYPWTHIPLRICHNFGFYLQKIVWPRDLAIFYPAPEPFGITHSEVIKGIVVSIAAVVAVVALWRRTRAPALGMLFFLVAILPTMGVVRFSNAIGADKYAYLPMLGMGLIVASVVGAIRRRSSIAACGIIAAISVFFTAEAIATRAQYKHWRSSLTLFAHTAQLAPRDDLTRAGLAEGLRMEGRYAEAVEQAREAIRLLPARSFNWDALGKALLQMGRPTEAIPAFEKSISLTSNPANAHQNLGMALAAVGRHDEAIRMYEAALSSDPKSPNIRNNLALSLVAVGRTNDAEAVLTQLLSDHPEYARGHISLARVYLAQGHSGRARRELELAVHLAPRSAEARAALANDLVGEGRLDDALVQARIAVSLKPDAPEHLSTLAIASAAAGKLDEAGDLLTRVISITPEKAEAYHNRALTLRDRGRFDEAGRDWETALRLKPDYADARYVYGKMLLQQERQEKAAAQFEALLKLEPGNAEVEALLKESQAK